MKFIPPLSTSDGRRAWAYLALLGGCIVMTVFAAVGVYLVSGDAGLSFWLALAAHAQIFIGLTFFGWAAGRRLTAEVGRNGISLRDNEAAQTVADAAQDRADEVKS